MSAAESWGALVREIEASKRRLPWGPEELERTVRVTNAEVKLRERQLDPVLVRFRDEERERVAREASSGAARRVRGREGGAGMFALLGHAARGSDGDGGGQDRDRHGSRFHVLSKLPRAHHRSAPTLYEEPFVQDELRRNQNPISSKRRPGQRRYDILTNAFKGDAGAVEAAEAAKLRAHLDAAYERTHTFDPILATYYDADREQAARADEAGQRAALRRRQMDQLPETVLKSEGVEYDIISTVGRADGSTGSSQVRSHARGHAVEREVREDSARAEEARARRVLNRVSAMRHVRQLSASLVPEPTRPSLERVSSLWSRVQTSPVAAPAMGPSVDRTPLTPAALPSARAGSWAAKVPAIALSQQSGAQSVRTGGGLSSL